MRFRVTISLLALAALLAGGQTTPGVPGIPAVQRKISELHPVAVYRTGGHPDWMAVTPSATWVADSDGNRVIELDPASSQIKRIVHIAKPCSGLAADFGSLWVPSCGAHALFRVALHSGKVLARIPASPADSEGGIATGAGSVWLPTPTGLARINPATNKVVAVIKIRDGSYAAAFGDTAAWITSTKNSLLTRVSSRTDRLITAISTGPRPRFLTVGAGSVWTLNQGDGTISRIDMKTNRLLATIPTGTAGHGGDIAFGENTLWASLAKFPITRIDPLQNRVTGQWTGRGGDAIRVANGALWLTDYDGGTVSRFTLPLP